MLYPDPVNPRLRLWRLAALAAIGAAGTVWLLSREPLAQDLAYHAFADRRVFFQVPNFMDVVSNLPFLLLGIAGLVACRRRAVGGSRRAWLALFLGVSLVSLGSAVYHWAPTNASLVLDRLPMTLAFMGLFAALIAEYVDQQLGRRLLVPALVAGLASVLYWARFDDLRFYLGVQFVPLMLVPALMLLFRPAYSHQALLLLALGCYGFAKIAEAYDSQVFAFTNQVLSGHTLKHLLAALGCLSLVVMIAVRVPLPGPESSPGAAPCGGRAAKGAP